MVAQVDRNTIDAQRGFTHCNQIQAGGGYDDIGIKMLARFQLNSGFGEMIDMVSNHFRLAARNGFEHVAIGNEAQALLPRTI